MKYVAFLRAVNVGGHAVIKMTDLKHMFESAGLENVQTYIQSGNVIFESSEGNSNRFRARIESRLEKAAGYRIQLFVRTMREVQSIVSQCPFTATGTETVHVAFLGEKPDPKSGQALLALRSEADDFAIQGREVYNLRRDRAKSVFSNNFVEKVLRLPATTRNLNTLRKIAEKYG